MKSTKYFFIMSAILISVTYSQVTEEQKQKWIQDLYSSNEDTVFSAMLSISVNGVQEALPVAEANYDKLIGVELRQLFLSYLATYKSSKATAMIHNFIDSIKYFMIRENRKGEIYRSNISDTLYYQIHCAQYLLDMGDYSRVQLIIDDMQRPKSLSLAIYWVQIFNEMPQYASIVKSKIIEYINDTTKPGGVFKSSLLYDLRKKQGSAFFPDMLEFVRTSPDPWIRHIVLFELLEMDYPSSLELLKERFLQDSYSTMKREIAETLLTRYGSISEYAFLKNNIGAVSRPIVAEMIQDRLKEFIPPKPSAALSVKDLLDTLYVLVKNVQLQNWLGNTHFANDLTKKLDEAKKHLTKKHTDTKDSVKCAKEVRKFQKKVNEAYEETIEKEKKHERHKEKFVTIEG
ncbi:MAG: HEAT repeat domain-containing protein [Bacteroidota bacterium]